MKNLLALCHANMAIRDGRGSSHPLGGGETWEERSYPRMSVVIHQRMRREVHRQNDEPLYLVEHEPDLDPRIV
jgi:hypothetical protein